MILKTTLSLAVLLTACAASPPMEESSSSETATESGEDIARSPSALPEDRYGPATWELPQHIALEVLFKPQEHIGRCVPLVTGLEQPCATRYISDNTRMIDVCTVNEDGLLTSRLSTYQEGPDDVPELEEHRWEVDRDALGRVTETRYISDYLGTRRCRFAYQGDSNRVEWRACDADKGQLYVYDDQGRVIKRYEAEKPTSDLAELQAWVPPTGTGFWSYIHEYDYDALGNLTTHRKCNGQTPRGCYHEDVLVYDARGRLLTLQRTRDGEDAPSQTATWTYNDFGLLIQVVETWPQGQRRVTDITYDGQGRAAQKRVHTQHPPHADQLYTVDVAHDGERCTLENQR